MFPIDLCSPSPPRGVLRTTARLRGMCTCFVHLRGIHLRNVYSVVCPDLSGALFSGFLWCLYEPPTQRRLPQGRPFEGEVSGLLTCCPDVGTSLSSVANRGILPRGAARHSSGAIAPDLLEQRMGYLVGFGEVELQSSDALLAVATLNDALDAGSTQRLDFGHQLLSCFALIFQRLLRENLGRCRTRSEHCISLRRLRKGYALPNRRSAIARRGIRPNRPEGSPESQGWHVTARGELVSPRASGRPVRSPMTPKNWAAGCRGWAWDGRGGGNGRQPG